MEETSKTVVTQELSRSDYIDLLKHYHSIVKDEIGFCYQYLNFYIGLLSAILAATLAGLLMVHDIRGLALLLGPILTAVLAVIGYLNILTFYQRFVAAWVTTINLEAMLNLRYSTIHIEIDKKFKPRYISEQGGFIPIYKRSRLEKIFGKTNGMNAEDMVEELVKKGYTLRYARWTFAAFGIVVIVLSVFIIFTVCPYLSHSVWFIIGIVVIALSVFIILIFAAFPGLIHKITVSFQKK